MTDAAIVNVTTMDPRTALAAAAALVEAFEALPLGVAFAEARGAAGTALAELDDDAARALIADVEPIGADVLADYDFYSASLKRSIADVAALHARCLTSHPRLARLLRNRSMLERIVFALPIVPGQAVAFAEVEAEYVRLVAAALRTAGQHEPWATLASNTLPALRARFQAAAVRHADHVASESERLERERREAIEAVARAERHRREEIAQFFAGRPGQRFIVRERVMTGSALSAAARGGSGTRDADGEFVAFAFSELETAYKQASAAAAAVA